MIYSPYKRRHGDASVTVDEWNEFAELRDHFLKNGTELRYPYRQASWDKPFWNANEVKFWILGPKRSTATSDTRELHDGCLVIKAHLGNRKCLFAGDASDTNLQDVATINHICDDILHASHHGSLNGANLGFIKKCVADYTVVSTASGVYESVPHPTAMKRYDNHTSKKVYRTDKSGDLKWTF